MSKEVVVDNLEYKLAWEKLKETIDKKLAEARREDEIEAYNGGFGGNAMRYEDFKKMMGDAWKGRQE